MGLAFVKNDTRLLFDFAAWEKDTSEKTNTLSCGELVIIVSM